MSARWSAGRRLDVVYYRLGLFALPIDWHLYSSFAQMLAKMSISAIQITFC